MGEGKSDRKIRRKIDKRRLESLNRNRPKQVDDSGIGLPQGHEGVKILNIGTGLQD